MKTKIINFFALSLLLFCSYTLTLNLKTKFKIQQQQNCFDPGFPLFTFGTGWKVANGGGELTFKATGRGAVVQMTNIQGNMIPYQYRILINGIGDSGSSIYRPEANVCVVPTPTIDWWRPNDYRIVANPSTATLTVFINGKQHMSCTDTKGWNAPDAQFFSLSRLQPWKLEICDVQSKPLDGADCFIPDPNAYKFQDDWKLNNGAGEINFKGTGNEIYMQINNQNNSSSSQYWIIFNGQSNTKSRITREGGALVCNVDVAPLDVNKQYDYKVILNPNTQTISAFINGQLSFSCIDYNGWNAPVAQYFSISRCSCANSKVCTVKSQPLQGNSDVCFIPSPTAFIFQDAWKLKDGTGEINFKGKGNDVSIQLNNQNNSSSYQYWIDINGWSNTKSRVIRGDGSEVCFPAVAALDLDKYHDFKIVLDSNNNSFTVFVDGQQSFSCTDTKGWNAPDAQFYSISRYQGANFQICNIKSTVGSGDSSCFVPDPNTYKFQDDWKLNNGAGEINFKGTGNEIYMQINNQNNSSSSQYWIIFNGQSNTKSRITREGGALVCNVDVAPLDVNKQYDYKVILNPNTQTMSAFINGQLSFSCIDYNGWNAPVAQYFSISRCSCANSKVCTVKSQPLQGNSDVCFIPSPTAFIFQDAWKLKDGTGEINFKGKGNDVSIQLNNQNNSSSYQYWIDINGWSNTKSRVIRGDGSEVCFPAVAALDLDKYHDFKIVLDSNNNSFTVFVDGQQSFSCTDNKGWNAPDAQFYSISRCPCANFQVCNIKSTVGSGDSSCFIPDPQTFKFDSNYKLVNGGGDITFQGSGSELNLRINNIFGDGSTYQYWMIINGWANTRSSLYQADGTTVCITDTPAIDLSKRHDYRIVLNPNTANITVYLDGNQHFTCTDPRGWKAASAQWFSVKKHPNLDLQLCHLQVTLPVPIATFILSGNIINAVTGKNISPLNGGLVTITNNVTNTVYNGQINLADSSYSATVPAGTYTVTGAATDFISATLVTQVNGATRENLVLSPKVIDNTSRVVLKWNLVNPKHLDIDIYVTNVNKVKEIAYYLSQKSPSGQLILDTDSKESGPETITIRKDTTDPLQIIVKNYNKVIPLIQSGAEVDIYRGNNLVKSVQIPNTPGKEASVVWDIGVYNPKDGTFTLNNLLK
jgi:hypothetical protein